MAFTRIEEKMQQHLAAQNLSRWTDPVTGMEKRRDLCGLMIAASRISVTPRGTIVSKRTKRGIPLTVAEKRGFRPMQPKRPWVHGGRS